MMRESGVVFGLIGFALLCVAVVLYIIWHNRMRNAESEASQYFDQNMHPNRSSNTEYRFLIGDVAKK